MLKRRRLAFGLAGALALGALTAVSLFMVTRGGRLSAGGNPGKWTTEQAEAFEGYRLLWLGEEFEGHKLMGVIRNIVDEDDDPATLLPRRRDSFLFVYGDCAVSEESPSCVPPVVVEVQHRCFMPPELFPAHIKQAPPKTLASGATSQLIGGHTRVWTGDVAITIYAEGAVVDRVLEGLKPLNEEAKQGPQLAAADSEPCNTIQGRDRDDLPLPDGIE